MNNLLKQLNRKDLFGVWGMTTELGYKTKRTNLNGLKECEDWLRNNPQNSIDIVFQDKNTLVFK